MEQSNKVQRSEVWEQIYKVVKTLPIADCSGMDAPDAPSVATELDELFLKLLPIQRVSGSIKECKLKRGTIKHVEQCRKMNGCCSACKYYR